MAVIPLLSGPAQAGPDEGRDAVSFLRVGAAACPARSNSIRRIDGVKPPGVYGEVAARKGSRRGCTVGFCGRLLNDGLHHVDDVHPLSHT